MAFDPYSSASPPAAPTSGTVFFDRKELSAILSVYGRMVAGGHWKDYGIDSSREAASFCVFRRASEAPLYRIEKRPALARKQGAWAVFGQGGQILKRGHELAQVLRVFEKGKFSIVD